MIAAEVGGRGCRVRIHSIEEPFGCKVFGVRGVEFGTPCSFEAALRTLYGGLGIVAEI